jgi:phosphoserine phosphatase
LPRPEANAALKAFLKTVPGVDAALVERHDVLQNAELLFERATSRDIPEAQRISDKDSFYSLVALLEGVTVTDAREAARVAVYQGAHGLPPWKTRVLAEAGCTTAQIVHSLIARGVEVFFLSATPDLMVEAAAELFGLGPGHALGSVLEVEQGRFTGRVKDNPYAIKASIARQWLPSPPLLAFGDSPTSDFPMLLEATGAGFMINARPTFLTRDTTEAGGRLVTLRFEHTVAELAEPAGPSPSTAKAP